jgi:hypothetical protein
MLGGGGTVGCARPMACSLGCSSSRLQHRLDIKRNDALVVPLRIRLVYVAEKGSMFRENSSNYNGELHGMPSRIVKRTKSRQEADPHQQLQDQTGQGMGQRGFKFFEETIWGSSLQKVDIAENQGFFYDQRIR